MEDEMVERVASRVGAVMVDGDDSVRDALCQWVIEYGWGPAHEAGQQPGERAETLLQMIARAAIAAMREPTNYMAQMGCRQFHTDYGKAWVDPATCKEIHRAMIDAALAPA